MICFVSKSIVCKGYKEGTKMPPCELLENKISIS